MTQGGWFLVLCLMAIAFYSWFVRAKLSRAWFFFALALIVVAVEGGSYVAWHRSALGAGGGISFALAVVFYLRDRKDRLLNQAALDGDRAEVSKLIRAGANPNNAIIVAVDSRMRKSPGNTPLMVAAAQGFQDIVEDLIDAGAHVDAADARGWTALIFAVERRKEKACEVLFKAGADPNRRTRQRGTALMMAAI